MIDNVINHIRALRQGWKAYVEQADWRWRGYIQHGSRYSSEYKTLLEQLSHVSSSDKSESSILLDEIVGLLGEYHDCISDIATPMLTELHRIDPKRMKDVLDLWTKRGTLAGQLQMVLQEAFAGTEDKSWEFMLFLSTAQQSNPKKQWLHRWAEMRSLLPEDKMCATLISLAGCYSLQRIRAIFHEQRNDYSGHSDVVARDTARGAMWGLGYFTDSTETRDFLSQTVITWSKSGDSSPALGYAGIWALAQKASAENLQCLSNLQVRITHRALKKKIDQTLEELAARQGLTSEQLADQVVPSHGLDEHGEHKWSIDDYEIELKLTPQGKVERNIYGPDRKPRQSLPKTVRETHKNIWKAIQSEERELKKTLTNQKNRLEMAMIDGRSWTFTEWQRIFGLNPIMQNLAGRLVWSISEPAHSAPQSALIDGAGNWWNVEECLIKLSDSARLALNHPLQMTPEIQSSWQRTIITRQIVQPFKQVFREVYVLTPAEEETGTYSNRFAAHVVPGSHLYALTRSRNWHGKLGLWGFDGAGIGWRDFPQHRVRAYMDHDGAEQVTIDRVWFEEIDEQTNQYGAISGMPLNAVPPIAFSETMRDVDMIVAVASIGTDTTWQDWELRRQAAEVRWAEQRTAYEKIASVQAVMRANLLRALIPGLSIEDRVELEGHFVLIRGRLSKYRMHLGSGNIHLEPSGRYLCIVAGFNKGQDIYLPFEENDLKTTEIISKILLLANDEKIRDKTILR